MWRDLEGVFLFVEYSQSLFTQPAEIAIDFITDKLYTEETQLLAMVNDLLYRLMDYQRNKEEWYDEEDIEQKTVMKLKEVVVGNECPF